VRRDPVTRLVGVLVRVSLCHENDVKPGAKADLVVDARVRAYITAIVPPLEAVVGSEGLGEHPASAFATGLGESRGRARPFADPIFGRARGAKRPSPAP
jgi:hypothetical protein